MYTICCVAVLLLFFYIINTQKCISKKKSKKNIIEKFLTTASNPNRIYKTFGTVLKSSPKVQKQSGKYKYTRPSKIRPIPSQFNALKEWKNYLSPIKDQKQCGNCWAQASIGVLSDRIALITNNKLKLELSSTKMTSCGYLFVDDSSKAGGPSSLWEKRKDPAVVKNLLAELQDKAQCNGQSLYDAVKILFVYGTSTEKCVPYKGNDMLGKEYNVHQATVSKDIPLCFDLTGIDSDTCTNGVDAMVSYRAIDVYNINNVEQEIKLEIMRMGPILAGFQIFPDFLYEYDGNSIYTHPKKDQQSLGGHAIKIVGWGDEEQEGRKIKYWIIGNSWGPDWGINGYFKMEMYLEGCELEDNLIGFIPDLIQFGKEDTKSKDIIDAELINLRNGTILPQHYVDEVTGLMNDKAVPKIKEGKLIGEIKPLFDVHELPPYNTFWAFDRKSESASPFSFYTNLSKEDRLRVSTLLILIGYCILMYFILKKV